MRHTLRCIAILTALATVATNHEPVRAQVPPGLADAKLLSTEPEGCGRHGVRVTSAMKRVSGPAVLTNRTDVSIFIVGTPEIRWDCEEKGEDPGHERTRCPYQTNLIKVKRGDGKLVTFQCLKLPTHNLKTTPDNYRAKRGFSFHNTNDFQDMVGGYSFDDLTEIYGKCETHLPPGCVVPDPFAELYRGIMNATLTSGQCFGFSLTSLKIGSGHMPLVTFPGYDGMDEKKRIVAKDVWHLLGKPLEDGKNVSKHLSHYIHLHHMLQMSAESAHAFAGEFFSMKTAVGFKKHVQKTIDAGGGIISVQDGVHGHVVVPYHIKDTGGGSYDILVYNSNAAWHPREMIDAQFKEKKFKYSHISVTAQGRFKLEQPHGKHSYEGPMTQIAVVPFSLYINEQQHLPTSLAGLFNLVFGEASSEEADSIRTTQIADAQGHTMFNPDGSLNTDPETRIPGAIPFVPFDGGDTGRYFILGGDGTYTHTITGRRSGNYRVRFVGRHLGLELEGIPAQLDVQDTVVLDAKTASVEFKTGAAQKPFHAKLHIRSTDSSTRAVAIHGMWTKDAPVRIGFDASRDAVMYTHAGDMTTLAVELSAMDAMGQTKITTAPIKVEHGDALTFKPNWTTLHTTPGIYLHKQGAGPEMSRPLQ